MSELGDLIEAAEMAPGRGGILRALVRTAEIAVEADMAARWLKRWDQAPYDTETRLAVARFLIESDEAEAGLRWAQGADPQLGVMRAHALLELGRDAQASDEYRAALAVDRSVADPELDEELAVKVPVSGTPGGNVVDLRGRPVGEVKPEISPPRGRDKKMFADVGGLEDVKKDITRKIILPFKNPSLFDKFKRKSGGGVLLYGPPGCGKTMMARATAGEVGASFATIEIAEVLDMYIGQSEKRLAAAFESARAARPTVLFFDEIEALAARRRFGTSDHGASLVSTFLNEMDGVNASNEGLLVLAATNVPWAIDTAFRRPGRFDRVIFIPPPDEAARLAILGLQLAGRPQEKLNLDVIAKATSGFSGADLEGMVETACDIAIEESIEDGSVLPIKQKHLTEALKGAKPTTLEWLSQARNYAKYANEGGLYDDVTAFLDKHAK